MLSGSVVHARDAKGHEEDEEDLVAIVSISRFNTRRGGSRTQAMTANQSSSPKLLTTKALQ